MERFCRAALERVGADGPTGADPVLAAGDREWQEKTRGKSLGISLDPDTVLALNGFAAEWSVPPLRPAREAGQT
jgi:LDH2 family malate/lactate/ureidoglycolate dehydrogenase